MKIEKGRLYYDGETLLKADYSVESTLLSRLTDKIAVHCPAKEDVSYVNKSLNKEHSKIKNIVVYLDYGWDYYKDYDKSYHLITIDQFKEFYPNAVKETEQGKKEQSNKLSYELDFDFITQMAERMQTNKGKYEPYNWKKPIDVEDLKQALFRHVIEVMNGNYIDDGREYGHLEAIACNVMMINYQLNNNK